jgi:hypothetical protein
MCGWQIQCQPEPGDLEKRERALMINELSYCVILSKWAHTEEDDPVESTTVVHGDIRSAIGHLFREARVQQWSTRPTRGELPRNHRKAVDAITTRTWRHAPSSGALAWALRGLNQVTMKTTEHGGWTPERCDRCGTGHPRTFSGDVQ